MKPISLNSHRRRSGFTLIEILVVIVIAAVLAAVTIGGYSAMRSSNARTSCQANMVQIYHALRLYAADYDGNVPYYDPADDLGEGAGIGLWALYGFTSASDANVIAGNQMKPEKRYLENPKLFHCPHDISDESEQMLDGDTFNPSYLSYQLAQTDWTPVADDGSDGQFTYNPIRSNDVSDVNWQRQLLHFDGTDFISRPPTDDTVVFWCPFHRNRNGGGEDNVLFWDGRVQSIPVEQDVESETLVGWQRLPEN